MQFVNHPFYIELMPESPEELRLAQEIFGVKGEVRSVMVRAAADYERTNVVNRFNAAAKKTRQV